MTATVVAVLASIPSPGSGSLHLGPLALNAYGLMIALGVVAAVWMFGRRIEARGLGPRDAAGQIAVWAVVAGVLGARLYHVITDWQRFDGHVGDVVKIWEGGLGIPGGLLAGIPVGMWAARRHGMSIADAATCAAPALPLAQAIGRLGNWFNQELFGRATTLPWALEIDDSHLPPGYASGTTFHPTFLYELLWNLALCGALLWFDRRWRLRHGGLLGLYVGGYGLGRLWVESLRIDTVNEIAGLRINQWTAMLAIIGGFGYVAWIIRRDGLTPTPEASIAERVPAAP